MQPCRLLRKPLWITLDLWTVTVVPGFTLCQPIFLSSCRTALRLGERNNTPDYFTCWRGWNLVLSCVSAHSSQNRRLKLDFGALPCCMVAQLGLDFFSFLAPRKHWEQSPCVCPTAAASEAHLDFQWINVFLRWYAQLWDTIFACLDVPLLNQIIPVFLNLFRCVRT